MQTTHAAQYQQTNNLIKKWEEATNRHFYKEEKHMKRGSTLSLEKFKSKLMRYHLIPTE